MSVIYLFGGGTAKQEKNLPLSQNTRYVHFHIRIVCILRYSLPFVSLDLLRGCQAPALAFSSKYPRLIFQNPQRN